MISIKHTIPALLTTFFLITATSTAYADLYIRFNSSGTGYYPGYNNWKHNYKPGSRHYSEPFGYSSNRYNNYRYPDRYQRKFTNRVFPGNRIYGYQFQPPPSRYDRAEYIYKRGYDHGFMDGRNTRHYNNLGRSGSMARKR